MNQLHPVAPAERLRAFSRDAILDAALQLLQGESVAAFSHETVAVRAGVSARTVYRHFPARTDLTLALWERIRNTTGTRWPQTESEILPLLRQTFDQFETHASLTRAVIAASASTGHPVHGSVEGRAAFRLSLAALVARLPKGEGDRLIGSCLAIYSAPFWQMLRDRGQLSADDARDAGAAAMHALLTQAHARAASSPHADSGSPHGEQHRDG